MYWNGSPLRSTLSPIGLLVILFSTNVPSVEDQISDTATNSSVSGSGAKNLLTKFSNMATKDSLVLGNGAKNLLIHQRCIYMKIWPKEVNVVNTKKLILKSKYNKKKS